MFCMVAALQYQSCLQLYRQSLYGAPTLDCYNFCTAVQLYDCTAGLLPILSTDLEAAQNYFWV
jgi:hypothetical protein